MRAHAYGVAAALLLCVTGCATPTALLERSWIELRSENFAIYTTLAEPEARDLLEDLELFRATVARLTKVRDQTPRVPTEIYAFGSAGEYRPFQPRLDTPGFFLPGLRSNVVALSAGENGLAARPILYHEYTHFLVHNESRAPYPPWFDEGFAELFSSVDVRGGMVRVGIVPPHRLNDLRYLKSLPYSRVIRARGLEDWSSEDIAMFYAQSWLIVHYLIYGQGMQEGDFAPRLRRYVELVEQRTDEEQAFRDAFGMDFRELEERMKAYVKAIPSFGIPLEQLDAEFETEVRVVAQGEISTKLGWLALFVGKVDLAQGFFERALAADPASSRAMAGIADARKFQERWDEAEPAYRRSLELGPDDWENHLEFGEYLLDRAMREEPQRDERLGQAREHFHRAIELAPEIPEGHAMLGMTYLIDNTAPEPGIAALERAETLLPSHPAIQLPLAHLHHRAGHRERAIELLRRVVLRSHGATHEASKLLDELEGQALPSSH